MNNTVIIIDIKILKRNQWNVLNQWKIERRAEVSQNQNILHLRCPQHLHQLFQRNKELPLGGVAQSIYLMNNTCSDTPHKYSKFHLSTSNKFKDITNDVFGRRRGSSRFFLLDVICPCALYIYCVFKSKVL